MDKSENIHKELEYLRDRCERNAGKILQLGAENIELRQELEQKRHGFHLVADLAATLAYDEDYDSVFLSASHRINASLNMQRTIILIPQGQDGFRAAALQGYPPEEQQYLRTRTFRLSADFFDPTNPVLVNRTHNADCHTELRTLLGLPNLIAAPILLHNEIAAVLITGRITEEPPLLIRLSQSDAATVQVVAAFLAAMLVGRRLVETEERTRIMLDATPLCCNFWDENLNNIHCNAEAPRLFDLASKQEYLERFFELSPAQQPCGTPSAQLAAEYIHKAIAKGYIRFEWMHQKLNGEPMPSEITLVRVQRGSGFNILGYTRDLREQKAMLAEMRKTEHDLRIARDLAEKNARCKSEFLANMSHEIRTPMNALLGMNHLLLESGLNEKQRKYVEKSSHSANLLLRVINDILDFSKVDAGKLEIESIPFAPAQPLRNVIDMTLGEARKKGIELLSKVDADLPDQLVGDPLRLEQILLNLVSNAIKFTTNGHVIVHLSQSKPSASVVLLKITVTDTGIGISKDQVNRLFTPFAQADTSTTRQYGGTGLGLAISRSLAAMMGGEIWCKSEEGKGSTFGFTVLTTLPTAAHKEGPSTGPTSYMNAASTTFSQSQTADAEANLAGLHVLLAEDNDINQLIAMELLESRGVNVDVVNNGKEALNALSKSSYDIVLMDIQMPEMDGLRATETLRKDPRLANLPIIAMTAHAMMGDREISLKSGMNDHITKPINPSQLFAVLQKWDRRHRP